MKLTKAFLLVLLPALAAHPAHAQATLTTLHSFSGPDGAWPTSAALVQSADGNLYGTTPLGGAGFDSAVNPDNTYGTAFTMTSDGTFTTLYSFTGPDGTGPYGGLVHGTDGNFYGTTSYGGIGFTGPDWQSGGYGTVFKMTPDGTLTTLYSFNGPDGAHPFAGLIQGTDGNFYGTTFGGGSNDRGTVFRISSDGMLTKLVSFNDTNGADPIGTLVQGTDDNFYGTTAGGGKQRVGTAFKLTLDGTLTTLLSFNGTNGASLGAYGSSFLLGSDGNFYGTAVFGGVSLIPGDLNSSLGTIFKMTPDGTLTTLHQFRGREGAVPTSLVQGTDGNFYGVTYNGGPAWNPPGQFGGGTVFKMTPDGTLTRLASFQDAAEDATLMQGREGNFYGTKLRGATGGLGTIFRVTVPGADSPKIVATSRSGSTVTLTWLALRSRSYQLQFTTGLTQPNWTASGNPFTATNTTASASDSIASNAQRFYRVVLLP